MLDSYHIVYFICLSYTGTRHKTRYSGNAYIILMLYDIMGSDAYVVLINTNACIADVNLVKSKLAPCQPVVCPWQLCFAEWQLMFCIFSYNMWNSYEQQCFDLLYAINGNMGHLVMITILLGTCTNSYWSSCSDMQHNDITVGRIEHVQLSNEVCT